jgi:hypothetical protein
MSLAELKSELSDHKEVVRSLKREIAEREHELIEWECMVQSLKKKIRKLKSSDTSNLEKIAEASSPYQEYAIWLLENMSVFHRMTIEEISDEMLNREQDVRCRSIVAFTFREAKYKISLDCQNNLSCQRWRAYRGDKIMWECEAGKTIADTKLSTAVFEDQPYFKIVSTPDAMKKLMTVMIVACIDWDCITGYGLLDMLSDADGEYFYELLATK